MQNIRTFAHRSPMFCNSRTIVSFLFKKKFLKKNYISYTPDFDTRFCPKLLVADF